MLPRETVSLLSSLFTAITNYYTVANIKGLTTDPPSSRWSGNESRDSTLALQALAPIYGSLEPVSRAALDEVTRITLLQGKEIPFLSCLPARAGSGGARGKVWAR